MCWTTYPYPWGDVLGLTGVRGCGYDAAGGDGESAEGPLVTTEGGLHRITVVPSNPEAQAVAEAHQQHPLKVPRLTRSLPIDTPGVAPLASALTTRRRREP